MTGDLAYKKIFPALYAMTKRGDLKVPVVGVASSKYTVDDLRARARASIEEHGGGVDDEAAFAQLSDGLDYVDGDYTRHRHLRRAHARSSATPGGRRTTSRSRPCSSAR